MAGRCVYVPVDNDLLVVAGVVDTALADEKAAVAFLERSYSRCSMRFRRSMTRISARRMAAARSSVVSGVAITCVVADVSSSQLSEYTCGQPMRSCALLCQDQAGTSVEDRHQ